ncbi:hypothetical protein [Balneola vulgaris]|uniref:hypothetical protein n=1 Tax=Balneola vulgaris TaxID=287535 RepID=UPI00036DE0BE|nr:hypothetical protein [Balneola vulgaris]
MKNFLVVLAILGLVACNKSESDKVTTMSLSEKVEAFLDADQYADALTLLDQQESTPEVETLREKTHLNYGLYLEYRDSNATNMRDKMNGALKQYIEVLKINPNNEKAVSEIQQILGIYSTFPDRKPEEAVVEDLKELGFEI